METRDVETYPKIQRAYIQLLGKMKLKWLNPVAEPFLINLEYLLDMEAPTVKSKHDVICSSHYQYTYTYLAKNIIIIITRGHGKDFIKGTHDNLEKKMRHS